MTAYTRREALALGLAGATALSGCSQLAETGQGRPETETKTPTQTTTSTPEPLPPALDVRGAIYLPSRAYNVYQMWANYAREVVARDFGYATRVNLNAIRTWPNYEFWREAPDAHGERLEHLLDAAADEGLEVVLSLFDSVGAEPTEERLHDTDPVTATAIQSPADLVIDNEDRWSGPRAYVEWVMDRYADDDRLLGIEVMNEPGWRPGMRRFARAMFETMREQDGSVPLTVGSTSMAANADYAGWGCEIYQWHYNFPRDAAAFRHAAEGANGLAAELDGPVWLTEWQRIRAGRGFHSGGVADQRTPAYATLAPLIHEAGFGNFFWSLMVKPAHVVSQREKGVINGLFHEDGAVWNLADARAIKAMSGEPEFEGRERQEWPEWAMPAKKAAAKSTNAE